MTSLAQLEAEKRTLLGRIEGWSQRRLRYRPSAQCWCAVEVLDHLVKTEERILDTARKGLLKPHRVGITDRIRTAFLRKVFESDRRVKVPASAAAVLPGQDPDLAAILERWQSLRCGLAAFHCQLSPDQMRQGIFKHPVGGWMALPGVVDFFYVHMLHHAFQLDRLGAESKNL